MKIGPWPFVAFGFMVGATAFAYGYWHKYQPNMDYANSLATTADATEREARTLPKTYENLREAQRLVKEREAVWQQIVAKKTPPASVGAGGIDLNVGSYQLTVDSRKFRDSIQIAVNKQVKVGGVTVVAGPEVAFSGEPLDATTIMATHYNYPAIPFPVVIFDLGQVTVRGSYAQIKRNVEAWSEMPNYLAVADGLAITGTSPNLTGTYNVSLVGYLKGTKVYPNVIQAGAPVPGQTPAPAPAPGSGRPGPGGPSRPGGPGSDDNRDN